MYQFTFPPRVYECSLSSTSVPTFAIYRHFDDSHSERCEVKPLQCGFDFHFSNDLQCGASFHMPVSHLYAFIGKISIHVFCPFFGLDCFFKILIYISSLYILDSNFLSHCLQIFSPI